MSATPPAAATIAPDSASRPISKLSAERYTGQESVSNVSKFKDEPGHCAVPVEAGPAYDHGCDHKQHPSTCATTTTSTTDGKSNLSTEPARRQRLRCSRHSLIVQSRA